MVLTRLRYLRFLGSFRFLFGLFVLCQLLHADVREDRDCLTCHKDPSLKQALSNGHIRSLYVDPRGWKADVHRVSGMSCVDCHVDATPFSHPVGGFHGKNCDVCHSEECEEFARTVHAIQSGDETMPVCFDCHTKHSVRRKDDAGASISRQKVALMCSSCHPSEAAPRTLFDRLAFFRVSGHKKEDISGQYDMSRCIDCHFREGAHGQPGILEERCATCHRRGVGRGFLFTPSVHAATVLGSGGFIGGLKFFYGLLLIGIIGGTIVVFIRKRSESGKGEENSAS